MRHRENKLSLLAAIVFVLMFCSTGAAELSFSASPKYSSTRIGEKQLTLSVHNSQSCNVIVLGTDSSGFSHLLHMQNGAPYVHLYPGNSKLGVDLDNLPLNAGAKLLLTVIAAPEDSLPLRGSPAEIMNIVTEAVAGRQAELIVKELSVVIDSKKFARRPHSDSLFSIKLPPILKRYSQARFRFQCMKKGAVAVYLINPIGAVTLVEEQNSRPGTWINSQLQLGHNGRYQLVCAWAKHKIDLPSLAVEDLEDADYLKRIYLEVK